MDVALHAALPLCPGSVPVVGTACTAVSGAAGAAAGLGVDAVFSAAGRWVASGAVWLLGQVGGAMSATTSVDLGAGWFAGHQAAMAALAAVVVLPMACCAAIQAVYRQSPSMLVRTFLVYLPLSLLLTGVAVELVRLGLAVTDALSSYVMASAGVDTTNLLAPISAFLAGAGVAEPAVPAFVVFVGGLLVAVATLTLWLELVVRAAAISAAVLFLPLALASLVWPAVSHWCRRLTDTLAALVLSKLVIAAVLSLAAAALAGGFGQPGAASGGGFAAVVTGIALLVIATLSPFTLLRLVPAVEAGAIAHLESTRHRLQAAARAPVRARNLALDYMATAGGSGGAGVGALGPGEAVGAGGAGGAVGSLGAATSSIGMLRGGGWDDASAHDGDGAGRSTADIANGRTPASSASSPPRAWGGGLSRESSGSASDWHRRDDEPTAGSRASGGASSSTTSHTPQTTSESTSMRRAREPLRDSPTEPDRALE